MASNSEFLMKSDTWDGHVLPLGGGVWVSEKMDGHRAFWDGGSTIGEVMPWDKGRSTGWWTNGGKPIRVPTTWTDHMIASKVGPTEGELWGGRGTFQSVSSVVRATVSARDWGPSPTLPFGVRFYATGPVLWENFWLMRSIKVRNKVIGTIGFDDRCRWLHEVQGRDGGSFASFGDWFISYNGQNGDDLRMVEQTKCFSVESVLEIYRDVVDRRGEGVMLRSDRLIWLPRRCGVVLKYKAWLDGEAKIVDTTLGEGRLDGLIGALTVRDCDSGLLFDIGTGMDDDFRKILPSKLEGHLCRYRYREKTDSGRPKEARFICLLD